MDIQIRGGVAYEVRVEGESNFVEMENEKWKMENREAKKEK